MSRQSKYPLTASRELTIREAQIVRGVNEGLTNLEIAARLGGIEGTVKNQLKRIFDKCGVWNRTELALWWERKQMEKPLTSTANLP